ncbi:MAG: MBL fold metallo-hydrolase [Oscillospiraceae bacterium]|nr:MBL fold metallo-hydrolase [Oscillospiraceae bacterium]
MARFCTLCSGSSGNSTYIGTGDGGVLVDVGISCKGILAALESVSLPPEKIRGILITHEHIDHIRGLRVLLKKLKTPVYASVEVLDYLAENGHLQPDTVVQQLEETPLEVGGMEVQGFRTSHDSVHSQGYRFILPDERKIAVSTDLGVVTEEADRALSGCDLVLMESNYDRSMLLAGPYPYALKRRIQGKEGHLSNEDCARQLLRMAERGTTRFVLGHLSAENNHPGIAYQTAVNALQEGGCREGLDFTLAVAPRYQAGEMTIF